MRLPLEPAGFRKISVFHLHSTSTVLGYVFFRFSKLLVTFSSSYRHPVLPGLPAMMGCILKPQTNKNP